LKPLVREGGLDCWDDTHIRPGNDWQQEIRTALDRAQVAVLLISADFFASDFIDENELPPLLDAAQAKGVRVLSVILSACRFARDPSLARFQAVNSPDQPLDGMPPAEQEKVLDRLAQTIESATLAAELESVKDKQEKQETTIQDLEHFKEDILKQLVAFSMAGFIYEHMKNIYFAKREGKPLIYEHIGQTAKRELQFLMDNGYIRHVKLDELRSGDDLAQKIKLTPAGVWYVELREEMEGRPMAR
jgi:hypothetical protein